MVHGGGGGGLGRPPFANQVTVAVDVHGKAHGYSINE